MVSSTYYNFALEISPKENTTTNVPVFLTQRIKGEEENVELSTDMKKVSVHYMRG